MWQALFSLTNGIALAMWVVLIVLPRRPFPLALVLYAGVALLCLAYVAMVAALLAGWADPVRDTGLPPMNLGDYSIAGLKDAFRSEGAIAVGWTHYLALDLFTGLWIARDADAKRFSRLTQAPQDVDFALSYVKANAMTRADQEAVLAALRFKCDVLWTQLDALYLAYVDPGMIPPGAFVPK